MLISQLYRVHSNVCDNSEDVDLSEADMVIACLGSSRAQFAFGPGLGRHSFEF